MLAKRFVINNPNNPESPHESDQATWEVPYIQFPGLSRQAGLSHAVYTRLGGVSDPPYRSLNTSYVTGDRPDDIQKNLTIIKNSFGADHLFSMHQVHGKNIIVLREGKSFDPVASLPGDALITDMKGVALLVKQADCQAVIIFDPLAGVISNVHCGWRGNRVNILEAVVERMQSDFGCRASRLQAAIGPSLGPCCAEFVTHRELFPDHFRSFMVRPDYFDLWQISRDQLLQAGLEKQNIETAGICTRCRTDLFYSYRAEGTTGRFATVVMMR
ncbi:MAG: peptidoglycan editing factor PgeF [Desulfatiglandales bacterium]